tara:strand:+ start:30 stop:230 length:201 start_codon:yes stop_codon:yes gene_type:complete
MDAPTDGTKWTVEDLAELLAYDIQTSGVKDGGYPLRFNLRVLADKRTQLFFLCVVITAFAFRWLFS